MTTLVIGRGLLGGHLVRVLRNQGEEVRTVRVPWGAPQASLSALLEAAEDASVADREWRLAWCAGAGVIASRPTELAAEAVLFQELLTRMSNLPSVLFLSSSVGGAYGGSPDSAPFTELSRTRAASPYGAAKLAMENVAAEFAGRGCRVVLGRIANLYGPGQNLAKPQGLVSQLCLAQTTGFPLGVYASLDTLRDYLFAPDAASMVSACLDRVAAEPEGSVVTKILASGRAASIGALIGESTRLARRRPRISTRAGTTQVMDLRVRSVIWPQVDSLARTPLSVGLHATAEDIARQMRTGILRHVFVHD